MAAPSANRADQISLDELVDRIEVKADIQAILNLVAIRKQKLAAGHAAPELSLHLIMIGNPGTGKTLIADILARMYRERSVLSKGHIVQITEKEAGADPVELLTRAQGGILMIDEAHRLLAGSGNILVERIVREMEKGLQDTVVIMSGLPGAVDEWLGKNPDLAARWPRIWRLRDYEAGELAAIGQLRFKKYGLELSEEALTKLTAICGAERARGGGSFKNGHFVVRDLFEKTVQNQANRLVASRSTDLVSILPQDIPGEAPRSRNLEDILKELDTLIGMTELKQEIRNLANLMKMEADRAQMGMKIAGSTNHIVFTGNPGTGKTTVARMVGEIFRAIGVLPGGHVIEVDRSSLVGQYVGQTEKIVAEALDRARGGILFIDEAYTLAPPKEGGGDNFGQQAIDVLMKRMEDERKNLVVIAAGYKDNVDQFLSANPGLKSRFAHKFDFPDYKPEELLQIFQGIAKTQGYSVSEAAVAKLKKAFQEIYARRTKAFGNGRDVRNLFEASLRRQARRLAALDDEARKNQLMDLDADDIDYELTSVDPQTALAELDKLVGMANLKEEVRKLMQFYAIQRKRQEIEGVAMDAPLHFVFTGNPGTGKTTVARIMGKVLRSIGVLASDQVVETDRAGLVGQYVGSTAKLTNARIDEAMGGILFIDEAYTLKQEGSSDSFGQEAIDTLLKRMEDDRGKFVVIAAGYEKEMKRFIESNSGLPSRFQKFLHFEDYKPAELEEILMRMCASQRYIIEENAQNALGQIFSAMYDSRDRNFANGRTVRNFFEETVRRQSDRITKESLDGPLDNSAYSLIKLADLDIKAQEAAATIEAQLQHLNGLIGLDNVKKEVQSIIAYLQVEKARETAGGPTAPLSLHYLFLGNPGTGKTTVARILAGIYKAVGLLPKGHLVEVDRSGLVAGYVGQTAAQTNQVIDKAIGGVLFIDEAYALASGGPTDFGKEAIDTLLKRMEDDRGKFVVIAAGYTKEMQGFLESNSGLQSRFTRSLTFDDYAPDELAQILIHFLQQRKMEMREPVFEAASKHLASLQASRAGGFANGRTVRNYFEAILQKQATRVQPLVMKGEKDPGIINRIEAEDLP